MKSPVVLAVALTTILAVMPFFVARMSIAGPDQRQGVSDVQSDVATTSYKNIYINRTCSGVPAVPYPQVYVFGMRDETGGCKTMVYKANTYEEALGCAEKSCPGCDIEDLTWLNKFSSSAQGVDAIGGYCPARNHH